MKNGCHNREPFSASYVAQKGWNTIHQGFNHITRAAQWARVEHVLSTDCRYSILTPNDPGCAGCKHKQPMNGGNAEPSPTAPRAAHGTNGLPDDPSIEP